MKLEIKHIAPYLPYGLKIQTQDKNGILIKTVDGIYKQYKDGSFMLYWQENYGTIQASGNIKLILRPLSDLTRNEMDILRRICALKPCHNQWTNQDWSLIKNIKSFPTSQKYGVVQKLLEWHFDIFGLIEKGLAIDINTLDK